MENSKKTGGYNNRFLIVNDETESLRTIDDIHNSNEVDDSDLESFDNLNNSIASNDRAGSQGLN